MRRRLVILYRGTPMLRTNPALLQKALEQLQQATLDHAVWRDHLLRVISGRRPCDRNDLAPDAYRRCLFGQWYFRQAPPELRQLPSFVMLGAEHEAQHRIAAGLLAGMASAAPAARAAIEEFEEASARLSYALYFVRREIECALQGRDTLTDAHNSGTMMRDLREWHALARQPGRQCCIAIMELDGIRQIGAAQGHATSAGLIVSAVNTVAAHLRLTDKVFRHDAGKVLIRLSGTDLASGMKLLARLRETVSNGVRGVDADGVASPVTASFGIALLDPEVDVLESIDRAEQALTLAKTAGRNRMIAWDPSVTTGVRLRRIEIKDPENQA
jgi:diguanylate cyclase (GGDEF)-like protein